MLDGRGGNDYLDGGLGNDTLIGDYGNDTLNDNSGFNALLGGQGNDTYIVDSLENQIIEDPGEGSDRVITHLGTFSLDGIANVENLVFEGTGSFTGVGSNGANTIAGGAWNDILRGAGGQDTLNGLDGNDELHGGTGDDNLNGGHGNDRLFGEDGWDHLDGGIGADTMDGGTGNDVYRVDNAGDVVTEYPGGGTDLVESWISHTLEANVENLTLLGASWINGTGNALDNHIIGTIGENRIDGGAGIFFRRRRASRTGSGRR